MVTNKRPVAGKKPLAPKKVATKATTSSTETKSKKCFFESKGCYISIEITEEGEYLAEVKEYKETETKRYVVLSPFTDEAGRRVYFEDVYLFLNSSNPPKSAAGQFLTLFKKARHFGDIAHRVVGIELNLKEGEKDVVFKNVIRVFKTAEDSLVFDDDHMVYPVLTKKTSEGKSIKEVLDEPNDGMEDAEAIEEDDDTEAETPSQSKFSDEIFDEEDVEGEEWEEE